MIKKVQDLGWKLTEIGRNLRKKEEHELVGQNFPKVVKSDNDSPIYRLQKRKGLADRPGFPDRTACSIEQPVRSAGLFDRLIA